MNLSNLSETTKFAINYATEITEKNDNQIVTIFHVLKALIELKYINDFLEKTDTDMFKVLEKINSKISNFPKILGEKIKIYFSDELIKIITKSIIFTEKHGIKLVTPKLFFANILLESEGIIDYFINNSKINESEFIKKMDEMSKKEMDSEVNDNSPLSKYSVDLTKIAKEGKLDPVIGRDDEIRRSIQVLSRRTKNNPVLIGEPGVGKTAIVEGLALRIINNDIPETLKNKKLISLDLGAIVAGAKFRGEFEERLKLILKEITSDKNSIILFIDEIHTLVGAGKVEGAMDASNLLKPALARGDLHCIGATTTREYKENFEKDAALARRFQKIHVNEPNSSDSISILRGIKEKYEIHHGVKILDSAIVSAVELSKRYINDRFLPDKAIDLIDEAASQVRIQVDSKPEELDEIERKILQNKIELESLKKDDDSKSKDRQKLLKTQIFDNEKKSEELTKIWLEEKNKINNIQKIKAEIDSNKIKLSMLQRDGKLSEAGELAYGIIPSLEKKIIDLESSNSKENDFQLLTESVSASDIAKVVAKWTGIPVNKMLESEKNKILYIKEKLTESVVGQNEAIEVISSAIQRASTGIQDPERPIGIFMFLGPTGVGKTELTKALSDFLFNDPSALLRIDMSEYMEKHSVSKLIGSPPGYVGYEDGGYLTESVRRKPYQVILFDEIEKAHFDIFNILLQVFDDGRLTDSQGRVVNFKNTILIMTSNLGANYLSDQEDSNVKISNLVKDKILNKVKDNFKPEFLNRLDDIIIFNKLNTKEIKKILDIQIRKLEKILKSKKIKITLKPDSISWLVNEGYNSEYGARPLKRIIQKNILDSVAIKILANEIKENDHIEISCKENGLNIKKLEKK
ncbi:MAG: ATP-dependent chaperone ClpB [Rickettsiales bacterium]|nr:ATP-dependent chaperone ClpB [Rickettsiales bacterium]